MKAILFLLVLLPFALSASISWTGNGGNQLWSFATNWNGNSVPTSNDDVVINVAGGAQVSISAPAAANSVTIAGGSTPQFLTLLSQLTVGKGGITVNSNGELSVQSNNDLPLSSTGPVVVKSGANFVIQSGSITGPGTYTVQDGANLLFAQTPLKQIAATTLLSFGQATIQASAIQLAAGGSFVSNGNLSIFGGVQIFSSDTSATSFQNYGPFLYTGTQATQPLALQVTTTFGTDLIIASGAVTLAAQFTSNASVSIPQGSTLTVNGGTGTKTLNVVKGLGTFVVSGQAVLNGPASVATLDVTDSGTLSANKDASFTAVTVSGTLQAQTSLSLTNLTLSGGTIAGPGTTSVSGSLIIAHSASGNNNNFIAGNLMLYGQGSIAQDAYLLFNTGGILHINAQATLNILASVNFNAQAGTPQVIVDGTISVTLNAGSQIQFNVNLEGNGALKVNAGTITFSGVVVTLGNLFLAAPAFIIFQTAVVTVGAVTGSGGFNLTAAPSPVSTLGSVALNYFGIPSGNVNVGSFAVNTFAYWNGNVKLSSGSANTAGTFNLYGGVIGGTAKISLDSFNIVGVLPISISGLAIVTKVFTLTTPSSGSIQTSDGAAIVAGSSSLNSAPAPYNHAKLN